MINNFTKNELNDLLKACSSIKKEGNPPQWKPRAILGGNGQPISLEAFMELERPQSKPIVIERNSKQEIKNAKMEYAREMRRKYGEDWKNELKRNTVRLTTFRQLRMLQYATA